MQPFRCAVCLQLLFFDNSTCLKCGSPLGFDVESMQLITLTAQSDALVPADGSHGRFQRCANQRLARCNWVTRNQDGAHRCFSCRLTTVRPSDSETEAIVAFADAEAAKRRLIYQLLELGLPVIERSVDELRGVAFEFLSSRGRDVTTGHKAGVITLDLSESDDAHREFVRQQLGEPYRTVLGHLRHEIGHYYWPLIVVESGLLDEFRSLFGDDRSPYDDALRVHYSSGGATDWSAAHVSQYASMHPWEDWSETFAHYLHIQAGLETADAFGLHVDEPALGAGRDAWGASGDLAVGTMVRDWLSLTLALNGMSRSIGQGDLYPFVLSAPVIQKLDFVHRAVSEARGIAA